ncbi:MAG TPA: Ku protein, partial [Planctomycetota bacterium]|nr:Ku protein [Planctomycetota bacterium]
MSRVLWKGSIRFGLVLVPVGVHPAEQRKDISFDLLDRRDHAPIGYRKVNKVSGEEVPNDEIVKAYQRDDGTYVEMDPEDFEKASPEKSKTIDISTFVDMKEIPPPFFDSPYYLEPLQQGEKPYALLREALRESGRAGVAQFVLRTRGRLAVVFPDKDVLVLNLLRYAHELREPRGLNLPAMELTSLGLSDKELKMALRLIDDLAGSWEPEKFKDEYRDELLSLIEKKGQGIEVPTPGRERGKVPGAKVTDL